MNFCLIQSAETKIFDHTNCTMIKSPKTLAFLLFILMNVLLAISVAHVNWEIFQTDYTVHDLYVTFREAVLCLILTIFFMTNYLRLCKSDGK